MGISNNIKVDVTLSGQGGTSIISPSNKNVSVVLGGHQNVFINKNLDSTITIGEPDNKVTIGVGGFQGVPGESIFAKGNDGSIQYNRLGYVSGAENFLFFPDAKSVSLKSGALILESGELFLKDTAFAISGSPIRANKFLIQDLNNIGENLLRIDPSSKKITFAENSTHYYVGVGIENPTEKLHLKGNLKVEGNIYLSGDMVPQKSGVSNLGAPDKPFKELYLAGDSINFAGTEAKISASKDGFSFLVEKIEGNQTTLTSILSIVTGVDGGLLKDVIGFAEAISGDASLLTGMHYKGLKDNGIFIEREIPIDSSELVINYGESLPYVPKVICAIASPPSSNDFYFVSVENVTKSGCKAVFSSRIAFSDFKINCFISPNDL